MYNMSCMSCMTQKISYTQLKPMIKNGVKHTTHALEKNVCAQSKTSALMTVMQKYLEKVRRPFLDQ